MSSFSLNKKPVLQLSLLFLIGYGCFFAYAHRADYLHESKVIIDIQPFSDIPPTEVQFVFAELKKVYPHVVLKKAIKLPSAAYNPKRNRFRADSLIQFLGDTTPAGHVTLGLTARDISTTKDKIADWGVMGLGFRPGNACIVSTFRLAKNRKLTQLSRVSLHELGHTQGLPHCSVKTCFMRDAEGHNPTNEETNFCPDCKSVLVAKGWQFK